MWLLEVWLWLGVVARGVVVVWCGCAQAGGVYQLMYGEVTHKVISVKVLVCF